MISIDLAVKIKQRWIDEKKSLLFGIPVVSARRTVRNSKMAMLNKKPILSFDFS